ncbi:MAG: ferritin family protein [Dehalococcoidia bacterium]|nr:ferritin family protein [Dehalococcoidia bacterium]
MDWLNFIKVMIIDERGAIAKYQLAANKADDPKIKAMFEQMRDEERTHIDILEQQEERIKERLGENK